MEMVADAATWIELDVAVLYSLPLVLAAPARDPRVLWALAALLVSVTFGVYAVQAPVAPFAVTEIFFVNRVFDAVAVMLTAGLLHAWIHSPKTLETQARLLKSQNAELLRQQDRTAEQNAELDRRRIAADEASARKTRILAAASHDIRTPVNAINVMAEVIRRTAENPALATQVPQLTARLQANARELVHLVSAVLDTEYFESGHMKYNESTFSANELLLASYREFLPMAQVKKLRLRAEMPQETLWVRTDRVKLHRVISNLMSNAIKFTETGDVTLSAGSGADKVVTISVSDTGIGMAPHELSCIFDEFSQLGPPTENGQHGWGLGLPICRHLVDFMDGKITVESESSRGSVFTVHLPAPCSTDMPESGPISSEAVRGRGHAPSNPSARSFECS